MISDPRQYTKAYPKTNIIIQTALDIKDNKISSKDLDDIIAIKLRDEQDALINVALNLAPDNNTASLIWKSLNRAVNNVELSRANIFAIPLILVAGSKTKSRLKPQIDTEKLNKFFNDNNLFLPNSDCFISGKLIDPNTISSIKYSQLYYWVRNLQQSKLWLPISIEGSSIETLNEGVFLRFLIGVGIDNNDSSGVDAKAIQDNLMGLMSLIGDELKTDGVTLFPIPFAPVPMSSAFAVGVEYRTEIAISVAISNIVKKMREERLTPRAIISTQGEAIKIIVKPLEDSELLETILWNLSRFISFEETLQQITNLLHDIGISYEFNID